MSDKLSVTPLAETGPIGSSEPFDRTALDSALDMLLAQQPSPHIMAANDLGLAVLVPAGVPVPPANRIEGIATALELCEAADLSDIAHAWCQALQVGKSQVAVHLRIEPGRTVTLHFIDARHRYGVFLGIFAGHHGALRDDNGKSALFAPRLCRLEFNQQGTVVFADDAISRILGWSRDELVGKRTMLLLHPDDLPGAIANWMETLARPALEHHCLQRYRHVAGHYIWFEITRRNRLADPSCGNIVADMVNVTDRMEAVEALRASEQLLRRLTEALPLGIVQIDVERKVVYQNERIGEIVGVTGAATIAEQFAYVAAADRARLESTIEALVRSGVGADIEITLDEPAGAKLCSFGVRPLTTESGAVTGAIACVADITERVRMREELQIRATVDNLTKCRNRAAILEALTNLLAAATWSYGGLAVFFIDLNHFKQMNDCYGHAAGDDLLRCVAGRLLHGAREQDRVGRLGGDEFLVVCPDVDSAQEGLAIAHRIAASLSRPASIGGQTVTPGASIGVAWTNTPMSAETLVENADAAMYEAKRERLGPMLFTSCGRPEII